MSRSNLALKMSLFVFICALVITLFNENRCEATEVQYNYFGEPELPIYANNITVPFCQFLTEQEDAGTLYLKYKMLYMEIFSLASGFRHELPDSEPMNMSNIRDRELQLTAQAAVTVWIRLQYMEDVDKIFRNASWTALVNIYKKSPYITNHVLHYARNDMFKHIDHYIQANTAFGQLFQELRIELERRAMTPSVAVNYTMGRIPEFDADNLDNFARAHMYALKLLIMDNQFSLCMYDVLQRNHSYNTNLNVQINFTDPSVLQAEAVSEAILRWAKTNKVDQIQTIVDKAVNQTRIEYPNKVQDMKKFADTFFDTIAHDIKENSNLKTEFQAIEDEFKKKYVQKH